MSEDEVPAELLGAELLGDALDPLEDDLSLEELGEDEEPEELGLLLLGELDIEPEPDDEEPEGDDSGLDEREPEAPVVEFPPRSQP